MSGLDGTCSLSWLTHHHFGLPGLTYISCRLCVHVNTAYSTDQVWGLVRWWNIFQFMFAAWKKLVFMFLSPNDLKWCVYCMCIEARAGCVPLQLLFHSSFHLCAPNTIFPVFLCMHSIYTCILCQSQKRTWSCWQFFSGKSMSDMINEAWIVIYHVVICDSLQPSDSFECIVGEKNAAVLHPRSWACRENHTASGRKCKEQKIPQQMIVWRTSFRYRNQWKWHFSVVYYSTVTIKS